MEELEELIKDADRDGSGSVDFQVTENLASFSIDLLLTGMKCLMFSPDQLTTATCMELNLTLTGTGPSATITNFLSLFPHNVATAASNSGKLSTQLFS